MLSFAAPLWLTLLPLPFLLWWLSHRRRRLTSQGAPAILHPGADLLGTLLRQRRRRSIPWQWLAVCMLLCLALARPQWLDRHDPDNYVGHNIMLAIDVSASMQAIDYVDKQRPVSRMDIVKQTAGKFLEQRLGDRIGLVVFGDDAYVYAPLTHDLKLLQQLVKELDSGVAGQRTAIGDALALATDKLASLDRRSRIIVLLTDGSNTAGIVQPDNAIRLARQENVHIYTIGIGHDSRVPFPQGPVNEPIYSELPVDHALLQRIADETGGRYFNAANREQLMTSLDTISQEQAITFNPVVPGGSRDLFVWPLLLAVSLLLISEMDRRRLVLP